MQGLYARTANPSETIADGLKKLDKAIQSCSDLSYYFFSLFPELKDYALAKFEEMKGIEFVEPVVSIKSSLDDGSRAQIRELAAALA